MKSANETLPRFRIVPQGLFNFGELIVDNFAGGGGASTGIEAAMGRPVDIAINHSIGAVAMHEVNHPLTKHFCESVWDVNPREVTEGRPVGLAWFSPDCTHFSKAKGGKPVKKEIRGLAWVVLRWAATVHPRVIMLENVEEFTTWGPLRRNENGDLYPCPKQKGRTFKSFINALRRHGYDVDYRELRACDYGAPTIRKRLFLVARCDGQPIVWPEPTHGDPASALVKSGHLQPWRTAADCIDWSIPAPSIFDRKKPLAEATLRRIAKGIMRYVVNNPDPFIVTAAHGEVSPKGVKRWGSGVRSSGLPLPTITATGGYGIVTPIITEHANASSQRGGVVAHGVDQPTGTVTTADHHSLVTAFLAKHYGTSVGYAPNEAAHTLTGKAKQSVVTSHLVKLRGTCRDGQKTDEPVPTVTASGTHIGEVRAFLVQYYGCSETTTMQEPMNTVTARDRFGLVTVRGELYQIVDIGMRMLTPRELFRAQGFPENYIIDRDHTGKPITKTEQVARCGNSVCPPIAEALVRANMVEAVEIRRAA